MTQAVIVREVQDPITGKAQLVVIPIQFNGLQQLLEALNQIEERFPRKGGAQ